MLTRPFRARLWLLPVSIAAFGLFVGAIADVIAGSPGDGTALLVAFLATGTAALILSADGSLARRIRMRLPSVFDSRLFAFGLFTFSAAAVFAKIAEDVVERESSKLDRAVTLFVHGFKTPTLDFLMRGFSFVGRFWIIICVALVVSAWCVRRKDAVAFAGLIGVVAIGNSMITILKKIFDRPRPHVFEATPSFHSYSFPSGHAAAAVAMYGMIAVVIGRLSPALKPWVYSATAVLSLLIGYSRIYLDAHWLTDVLGGYAAGAAILGVGVIWLEAAQLPGHDRYGDTSRPALDRS